MSADVALATNPGRPVDVELAAVSSAGGLGEMSPGLHRTYIARLAAAAARARDEEALLLLEGI